MDPSIWKNILWGQFGAAIDMLENALLACPDDLWGDRSRQPEYWYLTYHTLFFLDLYFSKSVEGFAPPPPFTLDELDPAGVIPEYPYDKDTLRHYLVHGRDKCRTTIHSLTEAEARKPCRFEWLDLSRGELFLYNMRHVQHHAAQLNLLLHQYGSSVPGWVRRTIEPI